MRRALWGVSLLITGLLATACADQAPPAPPPSTERKAAALAPAIRYVPKPTWQVELLVEGATVLDESTLVWSAEGLTMLDTRTGTRRWTIGTSQDLGGARLSADVRPWLTRYGVLVDYESASGPGVLLLSSTDGTVGWRRPVAGKSGPVVDADYRVALIPTDGGATVVNTQDGRRLWSAPGVTPAGIAGFGALVSSPGAAQSLDLITGESAWTTPAAAIVLAAGPYAVLDTGATQVVIDTGDGVVVAELGDRDDGECWSDQRTAIVCRTRNGADTFDMDARKARRDVAVPSSATAVLDRRVVDGSGRVSVDLAGTPVGETLPGTFVGVGSSHLLFLDEKQGLSAYPAR